MDTPSALHVVATGSPVERGGRVDVEPVEGAGGVLTSGGRETCAVLVQSNPEHALSH